MTVGSLSLFLLPLFVVACASGGVEPNWDAVSSSQGSSTSADDSQFQARNSQQYRVEFRRHAKAGDQGDGARSGVVIEGSRNGVRIQPNVSTRGQSSQRNTHQTSFVVGQAGHPLMIQSGGDMYQVVLGAARGGSIEVGVEQVSGPPDYVDHLGRRVRSAGTVSATRTRSVAPLGAWVPLSGFDEAGDSFQRESQIGDRTGVAVSRKNNLSSKGLEVRITPF